MSVTVIDASGLETAAAFTWAGPFTVNLAVAPAVGKTVRIRRLTPNDAAMVEFTDGAIVTEANLDSLYQQAIFAAADAADTGIIAAQEVRKDAEALRLWDPTEVADWLGDAFIARMPTIFKGDKGDEGDPSTVPGPPGPAPTLVIGNVTNRTTGTGATAALRPNGTGSYFLDLGLPTGATGSGASVAFGGITGNIADQTNLQAALDAKLNKTGGTITGAGALLTFAIAAGTDGRFEYTVGGASVGGVSADINGIDIYPAFSKKVKIAGRDILTELDGKQPAGSYAAAAHTHTTAQVTGLDTALAGKQKQITWGTGAPSGGSHGDVYFKVA